MSLSNNPKYLDLYLDLLNHFSRPPSLSIYLPIYLSIYITVFLSLYLCSSNYCWWWLSIYTYLYCISISCTSLVPVYSTPPNPRLCIAGGEGGEEGGRRERGRIGGREGVPFTISFFEIKGK